ncbi:uncharacterized protein IUM83_01641 [Phytophthora cinnamomi]|uniref:uncharacterized protein n=1 Tax=Phytophthora cinnamomi TaxID=4785 RepID=UPI003559862B|nr:hypothetical protein IUM83_01641 [Phytophthora cinnamomi]
MHKDRGVPTSGHAKSLVGNRPVKVDELQQGEGGGTGGELLTAVVEAQSCAKCTTEAIVTDTAVTPLTAAGCLQDADQLDVVAAASSTRSP